MSTREYDPRPVFDLIAESLVEALRAKDWAKVERDLRRAKERRVE